MRKDEIRSRVFERRTPETRDVELYGAPIVLHKLNWEKLQEARSAANFGGGFDLNRQMVAMLILSAHDEHGEQVFEPSDFDQLVNGDSEEIDRVMQEMMDLHGKTAKRQEEAAKALRGTGSAAQSSRSAATSGSSQAS